MQTVQTQLPMGMPILPSNGSNDQFGGMGGLTGLILGGALFGRNGGLFGNQGDGAAVAANAAQDAANARYDGLQAQFNAMSQSNQTNSMMSGFGNLNEQLAALNTASMNQFYQGQLATAQQMNAMQTALAACCCDNRVAAERTNANIAASEARLGLQICTQAHDTEMLLAQQTANLTAQLTNSTIASLQDSVAQCRQSSLENTINNGFNTMANAMASLAGVVANTCKKGNGQ